MIITLVGVMDNIDNDMMEAAESLGANRLTAFIKVVLPMSVPGMITGAVLVFTGSLTAYTTPQLLGGNKALVLPTLIYQRAMALNDWTGCKCNCSDYDRSDTYCYEGIKLRSCKNR